MVDWFASNCSRLSPFLKRYSHVISTSLLASYCVVFAVIHLKNYISTNRYSSLFFVVLNSLFVIFALLRKPPKEVDYRFSPWFFTFWGILLPLLGLPGGERDFLIGNTLQLAGILISIIGIISLNRSFGLVAANRGIMTGGLYRYIRHPLYFSYELSFIGYLINHFSIYNAAIFVVHLGCQIQRIRYEENLLLKDSEYKKYAAMTRWRLIPFLY